MITPVSEDALLITLADTIQSSLPGKLQQLCQKLQASRWPWLVDLVPSYTTLLVVYDPDQVDYRQALAAVRLVLADADQETPAVGLPGRLIELPVYYSEETGPDLPVLAAACELGIDEIIDRHTAVDYQVYAMGFAPGFGFMGEVDPLIAHPRKQTPRQKVPQGSVGIANRQTAVYPVTSPGGWQIIGRCPTRLFDRNSLSLLSIGDRVRFRQIGREEYRNFGGER